MKTALRFPLKINSKIIIKEGDVVNKGTILAIFDNDNPDLEIELSKILNVKAKNVFQYLKKRPSDYVFKGELIAEKKSFLNTISIKSPIKGKLKQIDLIRGTIQLSPIEKINSKLSSPVDAKIKLITKDFIEVEIKAMKLDGTDGVGGDVIGEFLNIHKKFKSNFEIGSEVEDKIVLIANLREDIVAKLDTLGAKGIISEKISKNYKFPSIAISAESFRELSEFEDKTVWLRPEYKEIFILEA